MKDSITRREALVKGLVGATGAVSPTLTNLRNAKGRPTRVVLQAMRVCHSARATERRVL